MASNERGRSLILALSVLLLAVLVGVGVPAFSGASLVRGVPLAWTPPAETADARASTATTEVSTDSTVEEPTVAASSNPTATAIHTPETTPTGATLHTTLTATIGATSIAQATKASPAVQVTATGVVVTPLATGSTSELAPLGRGRVNSALVNVRGGPSRDFPVIGFVETGEVYTITARTADVPPWYQICCMPGKVSGWIRGNYLDLEP